MIIELWCSWQTIIQFSNTFTIEHDTVYGICYSSSICGMIWIRNIEICWIFYFFFYLVGLVIFHIFHKRKYFTFTEMNLSLLLCCATDKAGIVSWNYCWCCWCESAVALRHVPIGPMAKMESGFNTLVCEEDNLEHPADIYYHQGRQQGWVNSKFFHFYQRDLLGFWWTDGVAILKTSKRIAAVCALSRSTWLTAGAALFWRCLCLCVEHRYQKTYVSVCSRVVVGLTLLAVVLLMLNISLGVYRKLVVLLKMQ